MARRSRTSRKSQPRAQRETSAGGVVFRRGPDGQVRFLLIRDSYKNWGFPKGHLEPGEPPADAARREVTEEARRAVKRGYPRGAGSVRLCRTIQAVERLLEQRLVDAVVLDARHCDGVGLTLPARFPRIPMYALSAVRPDDGALLASCRDAGFTGVLVEGVDNAVAGEWIAAPTAQVARRLALADAPRLLRLTDRLQLAAWEEVLRRAGAPTKTGDVAQALRG